jgi:hypothetical protein
MKFAMLCSAIALSVCIAATAAAYGPGQKISGGYYGGNYYGHVHGGGYGYGCPPGYDVNPHALWAQYYGGAYGGGYGGYGAYGVPALSPPAYSAGPPTPAVTYPYYTTRGPRDFLQDACGPNPILPYRKPKICLPRIGP